MELTHSQFNKLDKLSKVLDNGGLEFIKYIVNLEEDFKKQSDELNSKIENVKTIKGDKGDAGENGKDGINGANGIDGKNGIDGRDGKDGRDGRDGQDGENGTNGLNGKDGKDGSPDTAEQIASKINLLFNALDPKTIKGFYEFEKYVRDNISRLPSNFDVRIGVSKTDLDRLTSRVVSLEANPSGGFSIETPVGAVDDNNTQYIFTVKPLIIVKDGALYRENKGWTWDSGTLTATLNVPPQFDVFGIKQ